MDTRLIYTCSLVGFFLMWGVFGSAVGAPQVQPRGLATVSPGQNTPVVPGATNSAGVPVTGKPEPLLTEVVVFYGLIGFTALFLILALLNTANKTTAPYVQQRDPSSKKSDNG